MNESVLPGAPSGRRWDMEVGMPWASVKPWCEYEDFEATHPCTSTGRTLLPNRRKTLLLFGTTFRPIPNRPERIGRNVVPNRIGRNVVPNSYSALFNHANPYSAQRSGLGCLSALGRPRPLPPASEAQCRSPCRHTSLTLLRSFHGMGGKSIGP